MIVDTGLCPQSKNYTILRLFRMKSFAISLLLFFCIAGNAQKLKVDKFEVKSNDITARTHPRQDINGNDCALVKVQLAAPSASFDGNVIGDVAYDTSEYMVYLAQGSKRLTVKKEGYLPLEVIFEDFGIKTLDSKTVYVMTISGLSGANHLETPKIKTGWMIFNSEPSGATVYINDEFVGNTPLTNYKQTYGTYTYRLEHPNYHPSTGSIELNSGKIEKNITLKPAFGAIAITSSVSGAKVLLDGKATNKVTPCILEEVPSGQHTIIVQKDKYSPRQQDVVVEDGQTSRLSISLDARFAKVSITSLDGAQIYCNGELKGTTKYIGDLMKGYYDIEARFAHHRSATKQIQVIAGQPLEISLNPTPIYGSLDVTSTPHDAEVTIDGKLYGKTPLTVEQLLEGEHNIAISKEGYSTETRLVNIQENESATLKVVLKKNNGIISLNEGESLRLKLETTTSVTQLKIVGNVGLSESDWEALKNLCKSGRVNSLDLQDLNGITTIPNKAFEECIALQKIIISNDVVKIGYCAFMGCSGLKAINIPNNVKIIDEFAFAGCSALEAINNPTSVTVIGDFAFTGCKALKTINIPNSVTTIGIGAFLGCSGLTSINIPSSVTTIGNNAFANCCLSSITVDRNNKKYDSRDNCNAVIETNNNRLVLGCKKTVIPNSVTEIGRNAFYWCECLISINIPNSVKKIGKFAFTLCKELKFVKIPNSVTVIDEGAFQDCSGLTSIILPYSTKVGESAFRNCPKLKIIRK